MGSAGSEQIKGLPGNFRVDSALAVSYSWKVPLMTAEPAEGGRSGGQRAQQETSGVSVL